jgi:hypothetical protein
MPIRQSGRQVHPPARRQAGPLRVIVGALVQDGQEGLGAAVAAISQACVPTWPELHEVDRDGWSEDEQEAAVGAEEE